MNYEKKFQKIFKEKVKPRKIIFYKENKEPINDKDSLLNSVQNPLNSTFYFWFKEKKQESHATKEKPTDSKKKKESQTLTIKFRMNTTLKEVKEKIFKKFKI
ncbi:hypothetical protein M9Y10_035988 [Tritrichomonas musculus]|uniref:Ubiquitin-like domain-containing protein n=1 Tax=Tritrichomonas musculus TaxID=1915356 RepID=A0ABR2GVU0_9EUKA